MKLIKLTLIFACLIGFLYVAFNWNSIFGNSNSTSDENDWVSKDKIDIKAKCEKIRGLWAEQECWNEDLHNKQRTDIEQDKGMRLYSKDGYNTVNNTLRESTANKAKEAYDNAIKARPLDEAKLNDRHNEMIKLAKLEKMEKDARVKSVFDKHAYYLDVKKFCKYSHSTTPQFDSEKLTWTSLAAIINSRTSEAKKYKSNSTYPIIKDIPEIAKGLDEKTITSDLQNSRKSYYEGLSKQIVSHFSPLEANEDNFSALQGVYDRFCNEESKYGAQEIGSILKSMNQTIKQQKAAE